MKSFCPLALFAAVSTLLVASPSLRAPEKHERIEATAKKSHVFKTYLRDNATKADSKNGVVTLTGTVAEPSHRSVAQDIGESLPGVKSVENQLTVKAKDGVVSLSGEASTTSSRRSLAPSRAAVELCVVVKAEADLRTEGEVGDRPHQPTI